MAGRFERKKNGRSSRKNSGQPVQADPRDYRNDPYYNGSEGYESQPGDAYEESGYPEYSSAGSQESGYEETGYENDGYGQNYPESGHDRSGYDQSGYDQNGYDQNGYDPAGYDQNGYEYDSYDGEEKREGRGFGWGVLGFFVPLVGLILWLAWMKKKPRASRASGIGALSGFITGLVLVLVLMIGGYAYYNHMIGKVNIVDMTKPVYTQAATEVPAAEVPAETATEETTVPPTTEPPHAVREDYVNFLVVGQAGREGEPERFADTAMIVTLNKFDNSLTVTSLLRDAFVQPRNNFRGHNFGHIKLTTVYHLGSHYDHDNPAGSMELMNYTLFDNFGVEIDHNIEINFEVFEILVDCIDGVDIELDENEVLYMDYVSNLPEWADYDFELGVNHLDGYTGLIYARMRKAYGDGDSDIKRTIRQRKFMEAVMTKVKTLNVSDLQNIANEVLPMITTNMSKAEITEMMTTLLPKLPTMTFNMGGTCPVEDSYWGDMVDIYGDGFEHSVLRFDPVINKKAMREITLGEVAE